MPDARLIVSSCRGCRGALDTIVHLGALQLTGYLAPGEEARPVAPLELCACVECGLVQLRHTVTPDQLFTQYWYRSGVNDVMRIELEDVVNDAVSRVGGFTSRDVVLDIGANDGTLLAHYRTHDPTILRIAVEPAENLQAVLSHHAELVHPGYFPSHYRELIAFEGRVKVITSIAMIYAVDDLHPFLTAVAALLHKDGVWVVQFQDLAGMLKATAFDNICHEHLCYFSLKSFSRLLKPYGLKVVDAECRPINGGSYRLIVQHERHQAHERVLGLLLEWEAGANDWTALETFARRVTVVRRQIRAAIDVLVDLGAVVDLYGASTKANTLLQVCELSGGELRQAWERSPEKVGRRTAGSDVPIVREEDGRRDPPDALLVGIWQFRKAVLKREAEYLAGGGAMIFPLPTVDTVVAGVGEGRRVHA